jgi:hypothetical protein
MTTRARFKGVLESARGGGHVVPVDEPAVAAIGGTHMRRVKGTIEDTPFRSSLARYGGVLYLGVHKATVHAAGIRVGDTVEVVLALDDEPREGDAVKGRR